MSETSTQKVKGSSLDARAVLGAGEVGGRGVIGRAGTGDIPGGSSLKRQQGMKIL